MRKAEARPQTPDDYRALSTEQLLVVIAEKDAQIRHAEHQQATTDSQLCETKNQLTETGSRLRDTESQVVEHKHYIRILEEYLRLAKAQKFGASSEKLSFQVDLFDEAELDVALREFENQLPDADLLKPRAKATRKRGFPAALNRVRIELTLADDEKAGARNTFFAKVKEELEFIPAKLNVLEYWQEKAVFTADDGGDVLVAAKRPAHPLGKCVASTSLLAHIITAKYADGLPLYRQESILKRYGGEVSRSSMAEWIVRLETVFKPLIHLIRAVQNSSDYLQADETRLQVLKETGKTAQSKQWMWVIRGGPPGQPSVLFDYDPSRAGSVAERLLEGFTGVLQTDGYSGYAKVCRAEGITRIGCMDHARRKFVEAIKAADTATVKNRKGKPGKADVALGKIRKLYAIEAKLKAADDAQRLAARQTLAVPVLNDLKEWLDKNLTKVPKGSKTYAAIYYMLNQWEYLVGYCDDGKLHISNALAENAIRPFAVGRKSWLFADTSKGARASATCFSLIETAKANNLEPYAYIKYVLDRIGEADTLESIEALLPWNVSTDLLEKNVAVFDGINTSI
jgi:transposase